MTTLPGSAVGAQSLKDALPRQPPNTLGTQAKVAFALCNGRRRTPLIRPVVAGFISLPNSGEKLPLVILFDGQVWAQDLPVEHTLDTLIDNGMLPPVAVLMIDSLDGGTRSVELPRNSAFINDVADSLLAHGARRGAS
ncbi:enterochelin esterase [Renibacterium salmoninarum ATCC 33209]|uniref:Enterochelin esterase n=1 Tax=Renibacterium salmoninarum (strain ATCC 33209 / DSM 20767 / JCM 11484 / NBRC 15589 / NCIMB 2235) TaxID=288705 RepID=A9WV42_RENSM|nr:alpha/beta hydrolase-fold protein [Renibacterium salmoninarum]ABY25063.1 enterochelin esterase [Renibacterium salmoninarum ATCC 33209]